MYFQRALQSSNSRGECKKLGMGGGSGGSPGGSLGLPYITSKGLSPRGFLGKARILRRTAGKSLVQSRCISRVGLVSVSVIILFILFAFLRAGDGMECEISRVSVRIGQVVG